MWTNVKKSTRHSGSCISASGAVNTSIVHHCDTQGPDLVLHPVNQSTEVFTFFLFYFYYTLSVVFNAFFVLIILRYPTGQQVVIKNKGYHYVLDTCFRDK